jgi:putative ABC transport system ATP-binding protein
MGLIQIKDLTKTYVVGDQKVHALRKVSLDIKPGEFVTIVGPSGSGKSTFMHILGCLDKPTGGSYVLNGKDVSKLSKDELARVRNSTIGFVFQSFNLLPRTSAIENVELPLLYNGKKSTPAERKKRAVGALAAVGLAERAHHHPNQLSGGQQQRVAIARALMSEPPILLADEPTGNLDTRTSIEVMEIFQQLQRQRGITVIVITHEHQIAEYGTRVVSFRDGRIVSDLPNTFSRMASEELDQLPAQAAEVA